MYDLDKIVIIGNWEYGDKNFLNTVVLVTKGLKVVSLLYIADNGFIGNKKEFKKELRGELFEDQYDSDLIIKTKEVYNGEEAVEKMSKFISSNYNEDTLLYFFEPKDSTFDKLRKKLESIDGGIYLSEYHDIFNDGTSIEKNIYDIMKEQGIKVDLMMKDSYISKAYFLSTLIEKLLSR
jgi:hypothetical protein